MSAISPDKSPQFFDQPIDNTIGRILAEGPLGRNQRTIRRIALRDYHAIHQPLILQPGPNPRKQLLDVRSQFFRLPVSFDPSDRVQPGSQTNFPPEHTGIDPDTRQGTKPALYASPLSSILTSTILRNKPVTVQRTARFPDLPTISSGWQCPGATGPPRRYYI